MKLGFKLSLIQVFRTEKHMDKSGNLKERQAHDLHQIMFQKPFIYSGMTPTRFYNLKILYPPRDSGGVLLFHNCLCVRPSVRPYTQMSGYIRRTVSMYFRRHIKIMVSHFYHKFEQVSIVFFFFFFILFQVWVFTFVIRLAFNPKIQKSTFYSP